jgi:hypothetical protein
VPVEQRSQQPIPWVRRPCLLMVTGSTHELWVPKVSELPNRECPSRSTIVEGNSTLASPNKESPNNAVTTRDETSAPVATVAAIAPEITPALHQRRHPRTSIMVAPRAFLSGVKALFAALNTHSHWVAIAGRYNLSRRRCPCPCCQMAGVLPFLRLLAVWLTMRNSRQPQRPRTCSVYCSLLGKVEEEEGLGRPVPDSPEEDISRFKNS